MLKAAERFVWANWWDDSRTAFKKHPFRVNRSDALYPFFKSIAGTTPIKDIQLIQPAVVNSEDVIVLIFIAGLEGGGFISGGAAGTNVSSVRFRAASELFRHSLAISRIKKDKVIPESFYEKRLSYFGLGLGDKLVRRRLSCHGNRPIVLPKLRFDTPIKHSLDSLAAVHRCYFENQPHFIGGGLERLCI